MKQAFEVHVTNVYCVEENTVEAARAKALAAWAGQTADFEFGGMKITTMKLNRKIKRNGVLGAARKVTNGKATTKRTDRSAGKEREYIDFSQTDGI